MEEHCSSYGLPVHTDIVIVATAISQVSDSNCARSSMLRESKTWSFTKENEVALQGALMRMFRWMCGIKQQDRVPSIGLRERD